MPQTRVKRPAGVQFRAIGKIYHFDAADLPTLKKGDLVVVETARGRQIGLVVTLAPPGSDVALESIKPIERIATGRDLAVRNYWQSKEAEALEACRQIARKLDLPLKVVGVEYSFDGSRLLLLYTAEDKVDTQALKHQVSQSFRARIELKLIGPRDVAKLLGGYGACGELRCCSQFLTDFSSISIKMAKEQGISLNPQEITGMCGRLRCCLIYEYEQYVQARKGLPKRGKQIGTPHGPGVVVDVLSLKEAVLVNVGDQQFEVARQDIIPIEAIEASPQPASRPSEEPAEPTAKPYPIQERQQRKKHKAEREQPARQAPPETAGDSKQEEGKGGQSSRRRRRRKKRPGQPGNGPTN